MCAIFPTHLMLPDITSLFMLTKECRSWNYSLRNSFNLPTHSVFFKKKSSGNEYLII